MSLEGRPHAPVWSLLQALMLLASVAAAATWAVYRSSPKILDRQLLEYALTWPVLNAPEGANFIYASPSGMLLAAAIGATTSFSYVALHAVLTILAVAALANWTLRFVDSGKRTRSIRFILLSPVVSVLLQSIGGYDPLTVLGIVVVLWGWSLRKIWLISVASMYLGFQHFEQAIILSLVWFLAYQTLGPWLPPNLQGLSTPFWVLPGALLGKGFLILYFHLLDFQLLGTRGSAFLDWAGIAASIGVNRFPMTLWGGFAGLWLVIIFVTVRSQRGSQWQLPAAIAIALTFSTTTIDNLRVFVMLTVPVSALLIIIANSSAKLTRRGWAQATEGLLWLGPPQPTGTYALNDLRNFIIEFRSLR